MSQQVNVRWLIRSDIPAVLDIENLSCNTSWEESDLLSLLKTRWVIGLVAELNHRVVGFMIYELHKTKLHVLHFSVDPDFLRQSIGSRMIAKLHEKIRVSSRNEITLEVRESNLDAQLFFKAMGFKAISILHSHFDDTDEDAYLMRYAIPSRSQVSCELEGEVLDLA